MKLYLAVTADKYELPLIVEEDVGILAKHFNLKSNTILSSIAHNKSGKRQGFKFLRIIVPDTDKED